MTSSLRKKISKAGGLVQALRIISDEKASGALVIKASAVEGSIAVQDGRITAAAVSPTGERGEEALQRLADIEVVKLRYSKFYIHSSGQVDNLSIDEYLDRLARPAPVFLPPAIKPEEPEQPPVLEDHPVERPPVTATVTTKINTPQPKKRRGLGISFELGSAIVGLITLAVSTYLLPATIKSTAGGGTVEQRARQRLQQSLHMSLTQDIKIDSVILHPNRIQKPLTPSKVNRMVEEPLTEDLRFARFLIAHDKIAEAKQYYENYLKQYPKTVKPRLELINVYLVTKQPASARLLCLRTLKQQLSSDEMQTVWQLLGQCQTD